MKYNKKVKGIFSAIQGETDNCIRAQGGLTENSKNVPLKLKETRTLFSVSKVEKNSRRHLLKTFSKRKRLLNGFDLKLSF